MALVASLLCRFDDEKFLVSALVPTLLVGENGLGFFSLTIKLAYLISVWARVGSSTSHATGYALGGPLAVTSQTSKTDLAFASNSSFNKEYKLL